MSRCGRCGADASWLIGDVPKMLRDDEIAALRARVAEAERERDEARADSASWYEQCEDARTLALRLGDERDALRSRVAEAERERDEARAAVDYAHNEGVPMLVATAKDGATRIAEAAKVALAAAREDVRALARSGRKLREALRAHEGAVLNEWDIDMLRPGVVAVTRKEQTQ